MNHPDYDVLIIGGGVTGCAIARELSRYSIFVGLLEQEEDVCSGTSKANSAIIHAGFDAEPGTYKAKMNVQGSEMMPELALELGFPFRRNGAMVLCFSEEKRPALEALYERGRVNGVRGLRILSGAEARKMEPALEERVLYALYAETSGIVCPFEMTLAFAENARENGVEFHFLERVLRVEHKENSFAVTTEKNRYTSRFVVNAAGLFADGINNQVSRRKLCITARKGDYRLLDRAAGKHVSATIFQLPGEFGKGVLVTPTVHGNLLIGPSATDMPDRYDTATTREDLDYIRQMAALGVGKIPWTQEITSFSGLRAHEKGNDFVLGEAEDVPGFFNAAGIESPGLSSAPAIGVLIASQLAQRAAAEKKRNFQPCRRGIVRLADMEQEERARYVRQNPLYGKIVCRCEQISEGEIVDAIRRPLGAKSMDGIKRRVRAGMGRCQGGFCTPRVMEILSRELCLPMSEICKNRPGSELLMGSLKKVDT